MTAAAVPRRRKATSTPTLGLGHLLLQVFVVGFVFTLLALLASPWFLISDYPEVESALAVRVSDVSHAKALLQRYDPRAWVHGSEHTVVLSQRDVDLLLQQGIRHILGQREIYSSVEFETGEALLQASVRLPKSWFGSWLNLAVHVDGLDQAPGLRISGLQIGHVPIPVRLIQPLLRLWRHQDDELLARGADTLGLIATGMDMVQSAQFSPRQVSVQLAWNRALVLQLKQRTQVLALPPGEKQDVERYLQLLGQIGRDTPLNAQRHLPFSAFWRPLATEVRAYAHNDDELRTQWQRALTAMALRVGLRDRLNERLELDARASLPTWPVVRQRDDLVQHFTISAALLANADSQLADVVGLWKELDDAQSGSGFSFVDLLADRAGVSFATALLKHPAAVTARLVTITSDDEFFPPIQDLPENLTAKMFAERYGNRSGPTWQALQSEIQRRVDRMPLYR